MQRKRETWRDAGNERSISGMCSCSPFSLVPLFFLTKFAPLRREDRPSLLPSFSERPFLFVQRAPFPLRSASALSSLFSERPFFFVQRSLLFFPFLLSSLVCWSDLVQIQPDSPHSNAGEIRIYFLFRSLFRPSLLPFPSSSSSSSSSSSPSVSPIAPAVC